MGSVGKARYRYHATTPQALVGIYNKGLLPNRGMLGKGVYFSDSEQKALDWTYETTGGTKLLRVKADWLRNNAGYEDYDESQGVAKRKISTSQIEIKNNKGEWESLDSYARRYWRTFGIRK